MTEVISDGSCKRSTPKSRLTCPKASPQELRRPRFSFCLQFSNSKLHLGTAFRADLVGYQAQRSSEAVSGAASGVAVSMAVL